MNSINKVTSMNFLSKTKIASLLMILIGFWGYGQNKPAIESFEDEAVLSEYKTVNSTVSTSGDHYKFGKKSLKWSWTAAGSVGTSNFRFLTIDESPLDYGSFFPASPTIQMSLYNETPQGGKITISYEKEGKKEIYFDLPLDFKGWRTIWVPLHEMKGNAPKKLATADYDYFKIETTAKSGTLFFDDISFAQFQDDRHQYPDELVPFIKEGQDLAADHWMPLIVNYNRIKNLDPKPISVATKIDLKRFEQKIDDDMVIPKKYKLYINSLRDDYNKLGLKDNGTYVTGPPLTYKRDQDYYDEKQQGKDIHTEIKELGAVMKKIAAFIDRGNAEEKAEMEQMFLTGTKYFLDQGWVAGSNGGTKHHVGYNVRQITEAFFMMRRFLYQNGLLEEVGGSLHWLYNLGTILDAEENFHVNIDYLNTQAYYHFMTIFLFEKQEMQAAMLAAYSNFLSITLAQQKEEWGFKIDGTVWHHNGHYPAYGIGAFNSVPKIINFLARTRFRIGTEGHANFKKAFMASRLYTQKFDWGFGNAGRHPLDSKGNNIKSLKNHFLLLARSGDPTGKTDLDTEVAAAYLRLWGDDDIMNSTLFTQVNGINKENISGYYNFPYGATAVKRTNNWAALIKGYSKYVWASEIYVTSNRYGRYPANGTIQLLNNDGEEASGFKQEGWDWNLYPAATVINMPLKELEPKMPLIMFRSGETFAGTTNLGNDGIFGFVLNEEKGSNSEGPATQVGFPGRLKAKKSIFSFGDKLICIGTDISSVDEKNPTQTNLFQTFLKDTKDLIITNKDEIKKFPFKGELEKNDAKKNWIIDPYGNGYHILSKDAVQFKKEKQESYHNKYSINTGQIDNAAKGVKETEGNYASAWISHGLAPKNASYQYVIYPFNNEGEIKNFDDKVKSDKSFVILKADSIAHIVKDERTNTTGYVVFKEETDLKNGILKSVSKPALIMARTESAMKTTLSVVQPDLNFEQIRLNKFFNFSRPVTFDITLEGKWSAALSDKVLSVDNKSGNTIISLELKDGLSEEIMLIKK
tara:strand:+ start:5617 stop:8703 length:3087 start_codon:yes stop_codon:yes gene_type:complete